MTAAKNQLTINHFECRRFASLASSASPHDIPPCTGKLRCDLSECKRNFRRCTSRLGRKSTGRRAFGLENISKYIKVKYD